MHLILQSISKSQTSCLSQMPTRTCVTRAERTKLHLQVLYVRLNVKQIQRKVRKSHKYCGGIPLCNTAAGFSLLNFLK